MSKLFFVLLFFVCVFQTDAQELQRRPEQVFQVGEELKYKVKYGILTAGEATVRVEACDLKFDDNPVYHLMGEGHTAGIFAIYKVRDRYDSYIDKEKLIPYLYTDNIREGGYRRTDKAKFDQDKGQIVANENTLIKCENQTFDVVSAYFFARSLDLTKIKQGDTFSLNYYLTSAVSKVDITYVGKERIKTCLGYINCLKFNPSIQPGRIFRKNSKLYLWITDDGNRIPVRAQVEIIVGSVVIELVSATGLRYATVIDEVVKP